MEQVFLCVFAEKSLDFFLQTDSQAAGATVSITSMLTGPQARFVCSCWKLR
ncbi:MAG: hypothetical protein J6C11_05575 [Spirochaetaceae bacterium]|nr:hypothetical protein [Spirochaetaceae bacterium]